MNAPANAVPVATGQFPSVAEPDVSVGELVDSFLSGRSPATMDAYQRDLQDFADYLAAESVRDAASRLMGQGHGRANLLALRFKSHLIEERRLSANTVNRKLASLRSLVSLANTLGIVDWQLQVPNLKVERYGNVSGVGIRGVRALYVTAGHGTKDKAIRDQAILRVLYDLALRRAEVCGLDLSDLDIERRLVSVLGKGRTQKTVLTMPDETADALGKWLEARGMDPGALFFSLDHRFLGQQRRLTPAGIYHVIRTLGEKAGIKAHPHQIRHTSITEAVKSSALSGIGLDEVTQFSRHKNVATMMIYRDQERNVQGQLASQVAGKL
ncbi:MAG: tyrosine-type recombinase/integrase [Lentisphaerae bacterium]|jgi:integrase/recombinase XerC|nr:tyrosine-type recombinase/integrase [Lentisphaerota bacterium]